MQNKMQKNPRILCLHGFRTSAEILKNVIRKTWPETVLEKLDLHFLDAPFPARGRSDVEGIFGPPYFEWFQFNLAALEYSSSHFEKSIAYIEDFMTKHGPFDGLLGFSQGAVVAALLRDMQKMGIALTKVPKIKFLILISGAKFEGIKVGHHKLASSESPVGCPSLHFIGDKCFLKEWGILLLKSSFVDPVVIHHPRGHIIPKLDGKSLETMLAFIEKIQKIMSHDLWKKMDVKSAL